LRWDIPSILNIRADCEPGARCPVDFMPLPFRSTSAYLPVVLDTALLLSMSPNARRRGQQAHRPQIPLKIPSFVKRRAESRKPEPVEMVLGLAPNLSELAKRIRSAPVSQLVFQILPARFSIISGLCPAIFLVDACGLACSGFLPNILCFCPFAEPHASN
jgi:hypothetical protein